MTIKSEIITSLKVFIGFSIILGLVYPLAITIIVQLALPANANGSLVKENGKVVGSRLIGQNFDKPEYFNSRPSAINYNPTNSGGSNLAPSSKKLIYKTQEKIKEVKKTNCLCDNQKIPADMVLTSASGLDPHISLENANLQVPRIAKIRKISETKLKELISKNTNSDFVGIWGQNAVNVLELNIAMDKSLGK